MTFSKCLLPTEVCTKRSSSSNFSSDSSSSSGSVDTDSEVSEEAKENDAVIRSSEGLSLLLQQLSQIENALEGEVGPSMFLSLTCVGP